MQYLNAAPLTRGIESELILATPARLAEMLRRDELDAALVSITEVLLNDRYDILDGIAIASLGEVYSVILAHKKPLEEAMEIFCDTASLTSVNLLKVLLAEKNLFPQFVPLENYEIAAEKDFVLLIGDRAIDFQRAPHTHEIFDLGSRGMNSRICRLFMQFGHCDAESRTRNCAANYARQKISAWKLWIISSKRARNLTRIFGAIILSGTSSITSAKTRNVPSQNFPDCCGSTTSARFLSRGL